MIRHARATDYPAITAVITAAFGRADEADLVARLRAEGDAIFEMVAEEAGVVAGHIFFSRLWADRAELFGALAPLAVLPSHQRQGLGAKLVQVSLEQAREFGCHGVLVLGDPAYYGRFGFSADTAREVAAPFQGLAAFQALALEQEAFTAPMRVTYPDAFEADG